LPADSPLISVVTPSLNQGAFLERTVRSVLEQGYPRLEYVVQDGGSTDETVPILRRYQDRLSHWESAPDRGQASAINLGFRHTTGEVMAYLNSDDVLLPGALAYVARYFADHPDVEALYGHRVLLDEEDGEIGRWVLPAHDDAVLSWVDFVPQETLFWRRSLWDRAGGILDEGLQFTMDWDLLLRFRDARAKMVRVPRFLAGFRVHSRQKTQALNAVGQEESQRLRRRVHGRHVTHAEIVRHLRWYMLRHVLLDRLYRLGLLRH
jgi:glycosyltransferase involved in cell wall biosynthesis